jgi:hypothetical protein
MSESENSVSFVRTSCRCGLVSGFGKVVTWWWGCLFSSVVRSDAALRACHKSVDMLGYGPRNAVLEWAACDGGRIGCIVVRKGLEVRFCWSALVMSWCRWYFRIHVYCLGCVGRMLIGGNCFFYVCDVLLVSLFQISSRLSDVWHVTREFVNAAFFVLLVCVVRLGFYKLL